MDRYSIFFSKVAEGFHNVTNPRDAFSAHPHVRLAAISLKHGLKSIIATTERQSPAFSPNRRQLTGLQANWAVHLAVRIRADAQCANGSSRGVGEVEDRTSAVQIWQRESLAPPPGIDGASICNRTRITDNDPLPIWALVDLIGHAFPAMRVATPSFTPRFRPLASAAT